jgi:hypothetical protein
MSIPNTYETKVLNNARTLGCAVLVLVLDSEMRTLIAIGPFSDMIRLPDLVSAATAAPIDRKRKDLDS